MKKTFTSKFEIFADRVADTIAEKVAEKVADRVAAKVLDKVIDSVTERVSKKLKDTVQKSVSSLVKESQEKLNDISNFYKNQSSLKENINFYSMDDFEKDCGVLKFPLETLDDFISFENNIEHNTRNTKENLVSIFLKY